MLQESCISSNRGSELLPEIQNQSLYDLYEFNVPKELQPSKRVFKDFGGTEYNESASWLSGCSTVYFKE